MADKMIKQNWADEFEVVVPTPTDDDLKTIVEYKTNDDGKKVKVTRKIRMTLVQEKVNKEVAARKKLPKFGKEAGKGSGPDPSTTSLGDQVFLKLSTEFQEGEADDSTSNVRAALKGKTIVCRICKGAHFTSKCPYKDTLQPLQDAAGTGGADESAAMKEQAVEDMAMGAGGSAYVPPHLRGKSAVGASMESSRDRDRDDLPTLRISNLDEDTTEADLQALCRPFGGLSRVFLVRDRMTGLSRGYAFVSYYEKANAAKALETLHRFGYNNLLLQVEWSK
ncbi:translation initiation factor eIF3 subunit g [Dimargaris xerosporica]|nr:translation initiation factor eIF3 subunit g [Dimargaris xerosporica]